MSKAIGNNWAAPAALVQSAAQFQLAPNPLQKIAFGLAAFYIFLLYSRLQDFASYLHLPAITLSLALIILIISGSAGAVTKVPSTKWLAAMTFCMFAAIPFSVWPGGAADAVVNGWLKTILAYVVLTSTIVVPYYCSRLVSLAAWGVFLGAVIGFISGSDTLGRMGEASARFGDANEFAQVLLTGMSLMIGYSVNSKRNRLTRLFAYAAVVVMLVSFFRTGSRGGLVGLMVIAVFLFIRGSVGAKAGILVVAAIVVVCATSFLSEAVKGRYALLFGKAQNYTTEVEAASGSAEGREHLLYQSLIITARHPIFGVGTGMFAVAENTVARAQGLPRGLWHETHNMYTQVSSENGIPAVLFFITCLAVAYRTLTRIIALGKTSVDPVILDASQVAFWIRVALLGILSSGFFLSTAYTVELQVLVALSMGMRRSLDLYLQQFPPQPSAVPVRQPWEMDFSRRVKTPVEQVRPLVQPSYPQKGIIGSH
jgi:O-antigen ligase